MWGSQVIVLETRVESLSLKAFECIHLFANVCTLRFRKFAATFPDWYIHSECVVFCTIVFPRGRMPGFKDWGLLQNLEVG